MATADRIREHIVRHLKWDNSLTGSRINVDYVRRTAILTGTVPNLMAHAMAQRDALSIPGVDSVENRLVVEYDHEHPNRNDKEVQSDIKSILGCTAGINTGKIEVSVMDGIVTLEGYTDAYWKKERITELAASVDGVLDVQNHIKVKSGEKTPDSSIRKDIIDALDRMEVTGLDNVKVEVKDGVVKLTGSVPTWSTSFDIEDTARYTSGVVDVKNRLSVD